jgi:hypothetical protein
MSGGTPQLPSVGRGGGVVRDVVYAEAHADPLAYRIVGSVPEAVEPGARRPVAEHRETLMVRDIPRTTDAMLDTISDLIRERDTAHQEIIHFLMDHPEHESNTHLLRARISLL